MKTVYSPTNIDCGGIINDERLEIDCAFSESLNIPTLFTLGSCTLKLMSVISSCSVGGSVASWLETVVLAGELTNNRLDDSG